MFKHNLLLTYRNCKRHKNSFFINLIGLSTGLACVLLIYLWIHDELSIDKFNTTDSHLFQVLSNTPTGEGIETEDHTAGLLAEALIQEMPDVEQATAVITPVSDYEGVLSAGESHIKATSQFADQNYFKVFTCNFLQGNKSQMLSNKSAISVSNTLALKLFGSAENSIGKTVKFKNQYFDGLYTIAGIFNLPLNASTKFDVLFSYDLFLERRPEVKEWSNGGPCTFVVLKQGTNMNQFNKKITDLVRSKREGSKESVFIQQFSERYLYGNYENGKIAGGRITYVYLFSLIAFFILVIACINFINLATAKASTRMKEVGIKKTIGANRKRLIIQYLGESLVTVFIALSISIILTKLFLSQFNEITAKQLQLNFDTHLTLAILLIGVTTGLAAGSYPAFYLSGVNPVAILKGKLKTSISELVIRKGLVVFQFTISVILIVSVLVVYKQIQFVQNKHLGYDKNNLISFVREGKLEENFDSFISQVKNLTGVENASYMFGDLTGGSSSRSGGLSWAGKNLTEQGPSFNYLDVNFGLLETLGLKIKEGRSFSKDFGSDSISSIIFNEAAIEAMDIKDPIGKKVDFYGERQIVGVVENFHFESLHQKVKPFFFKMDSEQGGNILIKIKAGNESATIDQIQKLYTEFNPGFPFEYKFLDESYQRQYTSEQRMSVLSKYFAGLAILISCLGLFGLAVFTAERRIKEIGIRKVIGASTLQIVQLLSGDFTKIVVIAISIALPISYLVVQNWLNEFAYRIELQWWYFIAAGLGALFIAWITVGIQAVKAAVANPVKSLRAE